MLRLETPKSRVLERLSKPLHQKGGDPLSPTFPITEIRESFTFSDAHQESPNPLSLIPSPAEAFLFVGGMPGFEPGIACMFDL